MKKTLVALAALAVTSAFAQSSVSISGNADVGYLTKAAYSGNGKLFAKSTGIGDGALSPNRIILTVKEDLGGGTTATFYNEHGISPTNTTDWSSRTNNGAPQVVGVAKESTTDVQIPGSGSLTSSTNRGTYVGLANNNLGEVRAGFLVSSLYNTSAQSGYFLGMEQYGALLKDFGMTEAGGSRANGAHYISPKFGALNAEVQKQFGAERSLSSESTITPYTTNKAERTALRVNGDFGPLKAAWVHTNFVGEKDSQGQTPSSSVFGVAGSVPTAASNQSVSTKHDHLSAIYNISAFAFTYQYNKVDMSDALTVGSSRKGSSGQLGAQYTLGATTVYAITGKATMDSPTARVNDIHNTQVGVKYAMSKRTTLYAMTGSSKDSAVSTTSTNLMNKGTIAAVGLGHAF